MSSTVSTTPATPTTMGGNPASIRAARAEAAKRRNQRILRSREFLTNQKKMDSLPMLRNMDSESASRLVELAHALAKKEA